MLPLSVPQIFIVLAIEFVPLELMDDTFPMLFIFLKFALVYAAIVMEVSALAFFHIVYPSSNV